MPPTLTGQRIGVCLRIVSALLLGSLAYAQTCTLDRATGTTIEAQPFLPNALGKRWNLPTNRIAFMQPDAAHLWHIHPAFRSQ